MTPTKLNRSSAAEFTWKIQMPCQSTTDQRQVNVRNLTPTCPPPLTLQLCEDVFIYSPKKADKYIKKADKYIREGLS